MRRLHLLEQQVGAAIEGFLPVHCQAQLAQRSQEVTVAAEPAHVAAVEANHELLGLLARHGEALDPLEQESRADGLALAERIDLDESDVQRQLDRGIFDLRQRGLDLGQVIDEGLDQLTGSRVGQLLGIGVLREKLLDLRRRPEERLLRPQAVLVQPTPQVLEGLQELQHTQAEPGLVVFGRLLEPAFQGLRALGQLTVEQILLGQRRIRGGGAGRHGLPTERQSPKWR